MTSKKFLDPEVVRIVLEMNRRGLSQKKITEFYRRNFGPISLCVVKRVLIRDRIHVLTPETARDTQQSRV
jgi:hypothetical protein